MQAHVRAVVGQENGLGRVQVFVAACAESQRSKARARLSSPTGPPAALCGAGKARPACKTEKFPANPCVRLDKAGGLGKMGRSATLVD